MSATRAMLRLGGRGLLSKGLFAGRQPGPAPIAAKTTAAAIRFRSTEANEKDPFSAYVPKKPAAPRPTSPHLTVYKLHLSTIMSISNRITGAGVSVATYLLGLWYIGQPAGTLFVAKSSHLVSHIASLPAPIFGFLKLGFAASVAYHSVNGIRHLNWDFARGLDLKSVDLSGYIVLAGTAFTTIGFLMI